MSLETYREGYEAGLSDTIPERIGAAILSVVRDDDYNRGYADAAAGRDFDYEGDGD